MSISDELLPIVRFVMNELQGKLRVSLDKQGHNLTGALSDGINYEIEHTSDSVTAKMFMLKYGVYVEFGVPSAKIPFGGDNKKGDKGDTSLYIQGLISFFELRGLSDREAVSAAFATAHTHKREGMPSSASSRFSQTGKRTGFVRTVLEDETKDLFEKVEKRFGARLDLLFKEEFEQYEKIFVK